MPIPSRQIGWGTQENLLWQIAKQLEGASCQICTTNELIGNLTGATVAYGSFYSIGNQTGNASTELTMSLDVADPWNNGVSLVSGTQITLAKPGIYNIQFSAQMVKESGNSSTHTHIWIAQNGVAVPYSASQIGFPSNSVYIVAAWNWFVETVNPDEYVEIKWEINSNVNNGLVIESKAATGIVPAIPGLIVTVNKVD
jgi:hypothetical protein